MAKILSSKGQLSKRDKISTIFYAILLVVSTQLPGLINVLAPFLHLDAILLDTRFITLTLGNFITVLLFITGVIAKKMTNNGDQMEKNIVAKYLDNKTDTLE